MKIDDLPIGKVMPYPRNARTAEKAVPKVMTSLKTFGWRQPIVVDRKNVIVVGHARYLAAKRLGMKTVPVHVASDLTPQQIKAYRLMDNRSHEEAGWDQELLSLELKDLHSENGIKLADLTGFDDKQLKRLLANGDASEAEPQLGGLSYAIVVECSDEAEHRRLLERFEKEGFSCRTLIS